MSLIRRASEQTTEDDIVTTHDANVVSQIEQHARDVQAQPPVVEQDAGAIHESAHTGALIAITKAPGEASARPRPCEYLGITADGMIIPSATKDALPATSLERVNNRAGRGVTEEPLRRPDGFRE